jgi:hypothetical protein
MEGAGWSQRDRRGRDRGSGDPEGAMDPRRIVWSRIRLGGRIGSWRGAGVSGKIREGALVEDNVPGHNNTT